MAKKERGREFVMKLMNNSIELTARRSSNVPSRSTAMKLLWEKKSSPCGGESPSANGTINFLSTAQQWNANEVKKLF